MAGVTSTTVDHALKELYPDGVHIEILQQSPLLAMMNKDEDFVGRHQIIDIVYAGNRARSASFSNARSNGSASLGKAFQLTRAKNYAFGTIDRDTMKAATKNKGALIDALALESRSMIDAFTQDFSADVYSDGSGMRAQIDSGVTLASTTLTLRDPNTVVHFEVGDILNLSGNSDGTSIRSGDISVVGVDRDAGVLTTDNNISTDVAAATVNDYIYKKGDAGAKPVGIGGWVPASAPTSTAFFGVDRSVDKTRLGGLRYDGSSLNHEEALIKAFKRAARDFCRPMDVFMHPDDVGALELLLGSRKMYEDVETEAGIGFTALKLAGGQRIHIDPWAIKGYAFALTMETWTLYSNGKVPEWITEDGGKLLRQTTADGFEFMLASYSQFGCDAPGQNMRVKLAAI